jgi:hypothetical protein
MDKLDPKRFLAVKNCKKLKGSNAVELTYWDGSKERINRYALVAYVEMIDHKDAALFRERLLPATYKRSDH